MFYALIPSVITFNSKSNTGILYFQPIAIMVEPFYSAEKSKPMTRFVNQIIINGMTNKTQYCVKS